MKYEPSLDGLRGIAVFAVMGFHFASSIVSGGSLGVDMFFVLSGYLITSILTAEIDRTGRLDYLAFVIRRSRRLLPALGALLIAYAALAPLLFPQVATRRWFDIATTVFYVTNLRQTFWPADTPLSHTWSLAIEEQFYLLWPFVLPLFAGLDRGKAALWLLAGWGMLTAARLFWYMAIGGPGSYYFTPLHATGLLIGAAFALHPVKIPLERVALPLLATLLIAGHTSVSFIVTQPIAEIATVMLIGRPAKLLASTPLRFVGRISYGIYLWHIPLMWVLPPTSWPRLFVLVLASVAAGWLSHVLVERWFVVRKPAAQNAILAVA